MCRDVVFGVARNQYQDKCREGTYGWKYADGDIVLFPRGAQHSIEQALFTLMATVEGRLSDGGHNRPIPQ